MLVEWGRGHMASVEPRALMDYRKWWLSVSLLFDTTHTHTCRSAVGLGSGRTDPQSSRDDLKKAAEEQELWGELAEPRLTRSSARLVPHTLCPPTAWMEANMTELKRKKALRSDRESLIPEDAGMEPDDSRLQQSYLMSPKSYRGTLCWSYRLVWAACTPASYT